MDFYFILYTLDITQHWFYHSNCCRFGHWEIFQFGSSVHFCGPLDLFLCTAFLSVTSRHSRLILYILCANQKISRISKEPGSITMTSFQTTAVQNRGVQGIPWWFRGWDSGTFTAQGTKIPHAPQCYQRKQKTGMSLLKTVLIKITAHSQLSATLLLI